jgi:hypothetical protein
MKHLPNNGKNTTDKDNIMNEREMRALLKETEAAAKRYKAELNARQPKPLSQSPVTPVKNPLRVRATGGLGGGGTIKNSIR